MKKLFSLLFVFCVILLTGASAQPTHQWTKHYAWPGIGLYSGMTLITAKNGSYIVGGQSRLSMISPEGDSLWSVQINAASGKNCAVDALEGEYVLAGGNNSLLLIDYQGNLIRQISVPTGRDLLLNVWIDRISERYVVSGEPNIYEQNVLFLYDKSLNLISSHPYEGNLMDIGRGGNNIFTLQLMWSQAGPFNQLCRRNENYEVIGFRNFPSDGALMAIGGETVAILETRGVASGAKLMNFLNFQLDSTGHYNVPGDVYTAGSYTQIMFPSVYTLKEQNNRFVLVGRVDHYVFYENQGFYPDYPSGYLQAVSPTGETIWTVRDSGSYFISANLKEEEWIIGAGYSDLVLHKWNIVSGFNSEELKQGSFRLEQNYPNPFNPTTNIKFVVEKPSFVSLKVYDLLGNEVAQLLKKELSAGSYDVSFDGNSLASGIYIYALQTNKHQTTKKMVLMK